LRAWGIDEVVAEGRAEWDERAHVGDLAAMKARSRAGESAVLLDPAGLGGFRVLEWGTSGGASGPVASGTGPTAGGAC
jgi:hypothetical protein